MRGNRVQSPIPAVAFLAVAVLLASPAHADGGRVTTAVDVVSAGILLVMAGVLSMQLWRVLQKNRSANKQDDQ